MALERDFHYQLDRARSLTQDATCCLRSAGTLRLPMAHRRILNSLVRKLESAQQDIFNLKDPDLWHQPPKPRQLELL